MSLESVKTLSELGLKLNSAADIGDLIGAAYDLDALILHESDLAPDFFNLRTGLLGELFQKLMNYRKLVAVVIPDFAAHGERFGELAYEHSNHPQIRFVHSEAEAQAWLGANL